MSRAPTGKANAKRGKAGAKKATGRPSSFREEFVGQVVKLCRLGATEKEIADFFGVDVASIGRWKLRHPKFRATLKEGRQQADANVADRLYNRALGYSHKAVKILQDKGVPIAQEGQPLRKKGLLQWESQDRFQKRPSILLSCRLKFRHILPPILMQLLA